MHTGKKTVSNTCFFNSEKKAAVRQDNNSKHESSSKLTVLMITGQQSSCTQRVNNVLFSALRACFVYKKNTPGVIHRKSGRSSSNSHFFIS
jgi:hypothetical protein